MTELLFYGYGGHGQVVKSALPNNFKLLGFFDSKPPDDNIGDSTYLGVYHSSKFPQIPLVITIGDNEIRKQLVLNAGHPFGKLVSPNSFCASIDVIGEGTVVLQGSIIQERSKVGKHCIINAGSVIDHDAEIGDFAHIGPRAVVASFAKIGAGVFLGAGSVVPRFSVVPDGAILPAGTVFGL